MSAWLLGDKDRAAQHLEQFEANGPLSYRVRDLYSVPGLRAAQLEAIREHASKVSISQRIVRKKAPAHGSEATTLIGTSAAMAAVRQRIAMFALHKEVVLITGPTDRKELIARELHRQGHGAKAPLWWSTVALPASLAEAELFGHTKGPFTGADKPMVGACERAAGGVLFLDEIGSMPYAMVLLLRLLESGDYQRVGGGKTRQLAARIVSATNVPLNDLVTQGSFRDDLLFRLQRLTLHIPPLHQRPDDIAPLCTHFLKALRPDREPVIDDDLITYYQAQPWPGNVRQLRNDLELMSVLHGDATSFARRHSALNEEQPAAVPTVTLRRPSHKPYPPAAAKYNCAKAQSWPSASA